MDSIEFTKRKVFSVLNEITNLKTSDFSHPDGEEALTLLLKLFNADILRLEEANKLNNDQIKIEACTRANAHIFRFHPIMGFILRSTNVRNSFEFFDPILRLARKLLGNDAKLMFSSEWQFSPFTYPLVFSELPNFVLIGLPASESGNSLVIPLAGHELGHSVWRRSGLGTSLDKKIEQAVIECFKRNWISFEKLFPGNYNRDNIESDLVLRSIWLPSYKLSKRQCEEVFCDILGTRMFGTSYLYAFKYLLAPNFGGKRSDIYPDLRSRASYILRTSNHFGFEELEDYEKDFIENPKNYDQKSQFQLKMSDNATFSMVDYLIRKAEDISIDANIPLSTNKKSSIIFDSFKQGIPHDGAESLADIINAGWKIYADKGIRATCDWNELNLFRGLNAIIFKTIEVMEFNVRME